MTYDVVQILKGPGSSIMERFCAGDIADIRIARDKAQAFVGQENVIKVAIRQNDDDGTGDPRTIEYCLPDGTFVPA